MDITATSNTNGPQMRDVHYPERAYEILLNANEIPDHFNPDDDDL